MGHYISEGFSVHNRNNILVIINYLMYNELILSVQKFKESSPDTDVIPDREKLLFIISKKKTQNF